MSDITKKDDNEIVSLKGNKLSIKQSSFHQRLNEAKQKASEANPDEMPNRICLILDCSGSMSALEKHGVSDKSRIDLLKDAVANFASRCDFSNTSVAIKTFPGDKATKLVSRTGEVIAFALGLQASGGTPLYQCLEQTLEEVRMTRGVIVSDGNASDWFVNDTEEAHYIADEVMKKYVLQDIPIDCVHISTSEEGETVLRMIAKVTNGIFLKFTDVSSFSRAFGYLTPGYRALLTSGSLDASKIGAKEVKK